MKKLSSSRISITYRLHERSYKSQQTEYFCTPAYNNALPLASAIKALRIFLQFSPTPVKLDTELSKTEIVVANVCAVQFGKITAYT